MNPGLVPVDAGRNRCWWAGTDPLYARYHDEEWGWPVADDQRLFEKICLEGFQAGLSWLTVLRKREDFRRAFRQFEWARIARFREATVEQLVHDARLIRHRGKIESVVNNARRALALEAEFGSLAAYFWRWEPAAAERPERIDVTALKGMATTATSHALSRDLKRRGWTFVGPTTAYAFMQAMGLVNDHLEGCFVREQVERQRRRFARPSSGRRFPSTSLP